MDFSNPKELVWKAIANPKEIFKWLPDYKGTFDGLQMVIQMIFVNTVSGSHVTEEICGLGISSAFLSMSGTSLVIKCSLMENLNLLSGGSSSRTAIQPQGHTPYYDSQPPHRIDSFNFCSWLAVRTSDRLEAIVNNQVGLGLGASVLRGPKEFVFLMIGSHILSSLAL